ECLAGPTAPRLHADGGGHHEGEDPEPEREEATLGAVTAPPCAKAERVANRNEADDKQERGGDEIRRARHFLSKPPLAISSRCSFSLSSTHFTYSAPLANAGLRAPSSMYFFQSGVSVSFLRKPT